MNSDTPKGGIATPERPLPTIQPPQTGAAPTPSYPPYQYPSPSAPYRYPPRQSREPGGTQAAAWILGGIVAFLVLAGLVGALLVALIGSFAFATLGQHEQSTSTTKTFVVSGTPSLVISDSAGNVTLQQGNGNQVMVQVTKHAWGASDAMAKDILHRTAVDVSQRGNAITVTTISSGLGRRTVDLTVTVPAQANANVHLGAGNIAARQVAGAIALDTGAGNITAEAVTFAGTSRLHTGAGNMAVDGTLASRAAVDITVGAGNAALVLPSDTPAHLTASTGVGNLTITGWQIPVTGMIGRTASGDLGGNPTGTLTIQVGTGDLTLTSR